MLSDIQKQDYVKKGFLVLPQLFSLDQMNTLKAAALDIVDNFDPNSTRSFFSTKDEATSKDQYFLSSGDKVRCFFEEEAFDEKGEMRQEKRLSINKIGHALHKLNPVFAEFSHCKTIAQVAGDLGMVEPEIRQSMYIFKQPNIGGEIRWHQDATYFFTDPITVTTFWLAIEDATIENGCLQVLNDGQSFPLKEQFKRFEDDSTTLEQLVDVPWPKDDEGEALEVKAGTLVVFNGTLPHFSHANRSTKSRHAYTLHITSAKSDYDKHNWLQAAGSPLRV